MLEILQEALRSSEERAASDRALQTSMIAMLSKQAEMFDRKMRGVGGAQYANVDRRLADGGM